MAHPWKQNVRSISDYILQRLTSFKKDDIIVSCVLKLRPSAIKNGRYAHIGISWGDDGPEFPNEMLPAASVGTYSRRNREGYTVVHTELPKVPKTWYVYSPNFGDWSKGGHDTPMERDVYEKDNIAPRLLPVRINLLGNDLRSGDYTFSFEVEGVLDRTSPDFDDELFFRINLLQENVGSHNVYESGTTSEDYLNSIYVNWEILPPGERGSNIAALVSGLKIANPQLRQKLQERYDFLQTMRPESFVKGVSGFHRYFGARFSNGTVAFENIEYGNAMYLMFEDWETLSKLSRTELLASKDLDYVRIAHTKTWKQRVKAELRRRTPRGR